MSYIEKLVTFWICLFFSILISIMFFIGMGYCETRLNLGVGATTMLSSDRHDGQHVQLGFAHDYDQFDLGFRGGLEYHLDEHWAVAANYVRLGTSKVWTLAVSDAAYSTQTRDCYPSHASECLNPGYYQAQDTMQGPEIVGSYRWSLWQIEPFVTVGGAWMFHTANNRYQEFHGSIPMLRAGGGVCYGWLCADTTYYRGVGESGYPIVADALLSLVFVSVPLR